MKINTTTIFLSILCAYQTGNPAWAWLSAPLPGHAPRASVFGRSTTTTTTTTMFESSSDDSTNDKEDDTDDIVDAVVFESEAEKKQAVGNLVADDEWAGISMELAEVVRVAVVEDLKKNARDFLGKDEYKVGDIAKELDSRVKDEVAKMRGKDECKCQTNHQIKLDIMLQTNLSISLCCRVFLSSSDELGDFVMAMDEASKQMTEDLTGKPYEAGDLSVELDKRIKSTIADYCDKDEYEFGDLTKTVSSRIQSRVEEYTGKPYEFGDISRKINSQRQEWMKDFLGEEAAANYKFGDLTKKALMNFTGKDDYKFGDATKKLMGDLFGPRKKGGKKSDS